MDDLELQKIAKKECPNDSPDDAAFPNYSDADIWQEGFVFGARYILKLKKGKGSFVEHIPAELATDIKTMLDLQSTIFQKLWEAK